MKKTKIFGIITLICFCFALTTISAIPNFMKYKNNEIADLNSENLTLNSGDLISGEVDCVMGIAAEEYSTTFGIRTSSSSSKLYYVIWLDNEKYVLYETTQSEFDQLDAIYDETAAYFESIEKDPGDGSEIVLPTKTMKLEGKVTSMSSEIRKYFKEWYDDDSAFSQNTETLMITRMPFDRLGLNLLLGCGAAVLTVIGLVLTIVFWRKDKAAQNMGY